MHIKEPGIYHIYNRGNNKQRIFFNEDNYIYFLGKCHQYLKPHCDILAWCLMPNHFHFLIEIGEKGLLHVRSGITMPAISNGFRLLQSSYAKGVNKQQNRTGNLFQQKTRSKLVSDDHEYLLTAFFYIHQNPVKAILVKREDEWEYSSYNEFSGIKIESLCNIERAKSILGLSDIDIKKGLSKEIDEEMVTSIF